MKFSVHPEMVDFGFWHVSRQLVAAACRGGLSRRSFFNEAGSFFNEAGSFFNEAGSL
jgi:hypothetical protein